MSREVLVVDDEDDIRRVAQLSLERLGGLAVRVAADGRSAVAAAAERRPDAILLDVMMPGLDGPATVELLRADERTRDVPVVLLTARVGAADRARFDALGVAGVLAKPFDPLTLPAELSAVLGWEDAS